MLISYILPGGFKEKKKNSVPALAWEDFARWRRQRRVRLTEMLRLKIPRLWTWIQLH